MLPSQSTSTLSRCRRCEALGVADVKADILVMAKMAIREDAGRFKSEADFECALAEYIEELTPQVMEACGRRIEEHVDPACPACGGRGIVGSTGADVEQWMAVVVGCAPGGWLAFGDTFALPHKDNAVEWTRNPHGALGVDDWFRELWFVDPGCDSAIPLLRGCPLVTLPEDIVPMVAGNYFNSPRST